MSMHETGLGVERLDNGKQGIRVDRDHRYSNQNTPGFEKPADLAENSERLVARRDVVAAKIAEYKGKLRAGEEAARGNANLIELNKQLAAGIQQELEKLTEEFRVLDGQIQGGKGLVERSKEETSSLEEGLAAGSRLRDERERMRTFGE